ncbi:MAG: initiation factor 2B [Desulfurococcaceae archaeon]|jgi:translation initiation factor eIF-2B subunit delta|nr:initiation factor 2B [Desulfurococcaceae archaeon]
MRKLTGSELVFNILDELYSITIKSGEKELVKRLFELKDFILNERPASMAVQNILRQIGLYILEHGFINIDKYIIELRERYENSLEKAAEIMSRRIASGEVLLSNSNSLAVRRVLKHLSERGKNVKIYVTESRPGGEGLLLAEYAESLGFEVYLIVDSAVRFFMKNIDKVIVGAEAVASNGAIVSKIGTSLIALVAKEARKRVFVVAPVMKFSPETLYGELLKLPEYDWRSLISEEEITKLPVDYKARVPLYDVTPPEYIDAIVTEYGLFAPQAIPLVLSLIEKPITSPGRSFEEIVNSIKALIEV